MADRLRWLAVSLIAFAAACTHTTPAPSEAQAPSVATAPAVEAAVLRIASREGAPLWPNFDPRTIPLAIFDGTQTWLFRHPAPPAGFAQAPGVAGAHVMPGRHAAMTANTSTDIGGTTTATLLLDAGKRRSVDEWAATALHESFHVFQRTRHPAWQANEAELFTYPVEDVEALAWRRIETKDLHAALAATTPADTACWTREALLQRERRFARIGDAYAAYERGTELNEGLATYVELRALGRNDVDLPAEEFGPAKVRQRAYATGPALALLLDRTQPGWQATLEANDTRTLDQLLRDGLAREAGDCKPVIDPVEDAAYVAKARMDIDALEADHQKKLAEFRALPGWRLIIEAPADKPLMPQGFDPLNVERLAPTQVLHTRYVKLGNDSGSVEMLAGQALSEGVGPHPLFQGVRRVEIAGVGELRVERMGRWGRLLGQGLKAAFVDGKWHQDGQIVRLRLQPDPRSGPSTAEGEGGKPRDPGPRHARFALSGGIFSGRQLP